MQVTKQKELSQQPTECDIYPCYLWHVGNQANATNKHLIFINESCIFLLLCKWQPPQKANPITNPSMESSRHSRHLHFGGLYWSKKQMKTFQHIMILGMKVAPFSCLLICKWCKHQKKRSEANNQLSVESTRTLMVLALTEMQKNATSHFYNWELQFFAHCYASDKTKKCKTKNWSQPIKCGVGWGTHGAGI